MRYKLKQALKELNLGSLTEVTTDEEDEPEHTEESSNELKERTEESKESIEVTFIYITCFFRLQGIKVRGATGGACAPKPGRAL